MNAKRKSYQIAISLSLALTISLSTFEIVLSQNASQNTSQSSSSTIELTPEYVLELALSSPVFLNEASAKLEKAQVNWKALEDGGCPLLLWELAVFLIRAMP